MDRTEYLFYIYSFFSNYCSSKPFYYNKYNKNFKSYDRGHYFNSMTLPCFNYFKDIFYLNNIKIVPLNIYKLLTPIGLAFWIMDDGTYNKKGKYLILCTDNFSHKEVLYLIYVSFFL